LYPAVEISHRSGGKGKLTPPAAGGTSAVAVSKPEEANRPARPALPAAGGTSAAAVDESKRSSGKGQLTPPAAGGTSAVAVSKPEQVGRPARPALPAAGETSTAAAGAARQPSGVSGSRSGYRIPRLISPIRVGYFKNFQALPGMLDDCIIRAPKTIQDKFFFSVLMEARMVLSGRAAREYGGAHFRLQRKPERQSLSE
jgi:hypothetical protein